jgi:hypothetical protein
MQFARHEVATTLVKGPSASIEGINSRGSRIRFIQKIPRGGIQAVRRICSRVTVDVETYSTDAVQNIVRTRLIQGAMTQPRSAKRIWDMDGTKSVIPKLQRVSMIPCTIPNVIRMA